MKKIILSLLCILSMQLMAQTNMELAKQALDNEDFNSVIEYTTMQIKETPKSADAYALRCVSYLNVPDYRKALEDATLAIKYWNKKSELKRANVYALRAMVYETIGDIQNALVDYNMGIKKDKKNAEAYSDRAEFYYRMEHFNEAIIDYKSAIKLQPKQSQYAIEIARCFVAIGNFDEAENLLIQILRYEPKNDEANRLLAMVYMYQGENIKSIDQYIQYLTLAGQGDLDVLMYVGSQEFAYALKAISKQVTSLDNSMYWVGVRARLNQENKRYKDALEDLQRLEKYYGDSVDAPFVYYQTSLCYDALYEYSKAIRYYTALIKYEERMGYPSAITFINRASAYRNNAEYDKAIVDCNRALELSADYAYFAYYQRGWIKEMIHDNEGALEDYNKSILLDPTYAYSYLMRGEQYLIHSHDSLSAKRDFEQVLALDTIPEGRSCRQYALMFLGYQNEAKAWMNQILAAEPEDAGNYYDATCLYARMGEQKQALTFLRQAFEHGYRNFNHLIADDDMDAIRNLQEYKDLIAKYRQEKVLELFDKL